jgi:hypothetical protein
MSDLRERLREAAEAAAQEGHLPAAAVVIVRGRRRRVRLLAGTVVLVALAMVAGVVGADLLGSRPAPLAPTPTGGPTTSTRPTTTTGPGGSAAPAQVWIPSVTPLEVRAHPGPYPGPDPGGIVRDVTSLARGCHGTSRIRLWARARGKVWLIAAQPTPPGQARLCWASGLMNQRGGGGLGTQSERLRPLSITGGGGGGNGQLAVVSGAVTRRAVRLRVVFHKGRPMDLAAVDGGDGVQVNFFAGLYLETGPPPAERQRRETAVDRVIALDRAGHRIAECRMRMGPGNTC